MKQGQELVLSEMHGSIKELEQLSQGLQQELQQKEELYNLLKADFNRLDGKYQDLLKVSDGGPKAEKQQVKLLEEEITYLKKHFEIELGLVHNENEILKKELLDNRRRGTPNQKQANSFCSPPRGGPTDLDNSSYDRHHFGFRGTLDTSPLPGFGGGALSREL